MTSEINPQPESDFRDKILEILISLRDDYGLKNREISSRLGLNENYLSRVFNKDGSGSVQLLRGTEMLLQILKSQGSEERVKILEREMFERRATRFGLRLAHRALTAARACSEVRALACPVPAFPPSFPSATAAGFFIGRERGRGALRSTSLRFRFCCSRGLRRR